MTKTNMKTLSSRRN